MQIILTKVYKSSSMVIVPVMLLLCLVCKWPTLMVLFAMLASIAISSPATICLHIMTWLSQKANLERSFVWMILMASIPLFAFIAAWVFADYVPGKVWLLLVLGMLSGYVGIFTNAISVAQLFNPVQNEREEHDTID